MSMDSHRLPGGDSRISEYTRRVPKIVSAILPVNVAGLALIGVSVVLFILDIYAPTETPIRASAAGIVTSVVRVTNALGYGQYVQISTTISGARSLSENRIDDS